MAARENVVGGAAAFMVVVVGVAARDLMSEAWCPLRNARRREIVGYVLRKESDDGQSMAALARRAASRRNGRRQAAWGSRGEDIVEGVARAVGIWVEGYQNCPA